MSYIGTPGTGSPGARGSDYAQFDSTRYWAGAGATALVAALISFVGYQVFKWTLGTPILTPIGDGVWGNAQFAVLVTMVASGLLFLLSLGAPQPRTFFRWIMAVGTLASVVYPFSTTAKFPVMASSAVVNVFLGIAILTLLSASAVRATIRPAVPVTLPASAPVPQQPRYGPNYIGSARAPREEPRPTLRFGARAAGDGVSTPPYGTPPLPPEASTPPYGTSTLRPDARQDPGQYQQSQQYQGQYPGESGPVRLVYRQPSDQPDQPDHAPDPPQQPLPPDYGWDEEERSGGH